MKNNPRGGCSCFRLLSCCFVFVRCQCDSSIIMMAHLIPPVTWYKLVYHMILPPYDSSLSLSLSLSRQSG